MPLDLEAEYNNRARVPEHPALIAGWARDAAAYREAQPHEVDVAYGPSPRERYDFFPAGVDAPVVLFVHGGYWQALDKTFFSHMAKGPNARGIAVAVMSYDLCPEVPLAGIVDQVRACALALWRRTGRKVIACGHSAGGHLTAMLLSTDWRTLDPAAPVDLVTAGLAISGLFDLPPLVPTSVNVKLGLDEAEAMRLSPAFMHPNTGTRLIAVVGGDESGEYLRQSRLIAENWAPLGCNAQDRPIAGANHFTVIASLAEPDGGLTRLLANLVTHAP
ncbi:MAG TPA: alpha/beta hydrolase [Rhabdaerophilum sp.]|nr:alpha/beta hydrolase [Rhabdaerophilum sp.]